MKNFLLGHDSLIFISKIIIIIINIFLDHLGKEFFFISDKINLDSTFSILVLFREFFASTFFTQKGFFKIFQRLFVLNNVRVRVSVNVRIN